jgi:AcrR family transcriptional regulator
MPRSERPPSARKASSASPRKPRRGAYHHGNLRQALIDAALELAGEVGAEAVTVREAARRAGVSPGAPFRHFADRTMLMTAVAEEAMSRLRAEVEVNLAPVRGEGPLQRLHALGTAYLHWVESNPTHFQIISRRDCIDFEGSAALVSDNAALQALMRTLLVEAREKGRLRPVDLRLAVIVSRALVYGLARMHTDGHFPSWNVAPEETSAVMAGSLSLFISLLGTDPPRTHARKRPRRRATRHRRTPDASE